VAALKPPPATLRDPSAVATVHGIDASAFQRALLHYAGVKRRQCLSDADFLAQLLKHRTLLPLAWASGDDDAMGAALRALARQINAEPVTDTSALNLALAALREVGCMPLLLKGRAFAYSFYPDAKLRRATDDDILVPAALRERAHDALTAAGYRARTFGALHTICGQAVYTRALDDGLHVIDLHWELGNLFEFFGRFDFDELNHDSVPVNEPTLHARQLGAAHSLVHAAMHYFTEPLEWERSDLVLLDVAQIAQQLLASDWLKVSEIAQRTRLSAVLAEALRRAMQLYALSIDGAALVALEQAARQEPGSTLLQARRTQQPVWAPLFAARPLSERFAYAVRQLFPPARYMRANYALQSGSMPLLRAYGRRLLKGCRHLLLFSE
jgi:hypothetical protein